jgi:hypothetical protein
VWKEEIDNVYIIFPVITVVNHPIGFLAKLNRFIRPMTKSTGARREQRKQRKGENKGERYLIQFRLKIRGISGRRKAPRQHGLEV